MALQPRLVQRKGSKVVKFTREKKKKKKKISKSFVSTPSQWMRNFYEKRCESIGNRKEVGPVLPVAPSLGGNFSSCVNA